jgi:hypothetical protein
MSYNLERLKRCSDDEDNEGFTRQTKNLPDPLRRVRASVMFMSWSGITATDNRQAGPNRVEHDRSTPVCPDRDGLAAFGKR